MSRIQKNNTSFLTITSVLVSDTWGDLSTGLSGYGNALVTDMSNNLYAGGIFTNAGGVSVNRVAMWNGASWVALGSSTFKGVNLSSDPISSIVSTLILDNSRNLYVGGYFDQVGLPVEANNVAKWNGAEWNRLSVSDSGVNNRVYALAFDNNNNLYAGGIFTTAGGNPASRIARWNGTSWSALGTGIGIIGVYALLVNTNNLFVGGNFETAGGITVNNIAKWDINTNTWSALAPGITGSNEIIFDLAIDESNNLYACGAFTTIGGISANYIAIWNGSSWSALPLQVNNVVYSIKYKNGKLYATGSFTQAGSLSVSNVALWDGNSWSSLNCNTNSIVYDSAIDNNNKIYITGAFTTPGTRVAQQIQTTSVSSVIIPSQSANSKRIGII